MWSNTAQQAASGDPALGGQFASACSPPRSPICIEWIAAQSTSIEHSNGGMIRRVATTFTRVLLKAKALAVNHSSAQQTLCRCLERVSNCGGERSPSHGHVNCGGTAHSGRTGATAHASGQSFTSAASRKATSVSGCDPPPGMPCRCGSNS